LHRTAARDRENNFAQAPALFQQVERQPAEATSSASHRETLLFKRRDSRGCGEHGCTLGAQSLRISGRRTEIQVERQSIWLGSDAAGFADEPRSLRGRLEIKIPLGNGHDFRNDRARIVVAVNPRAELARASSDTPALIDTGILSELIKLSNVDGRPEK
jgi:hypothetical protein